MTDGSVNPSELATLSLLGRGGIGVGNGGGYGYGGGREFANDSSNAVRINASERLSQQAHTNNHDASRDSHDALSQQISDNADRNRDLASSQSANARDIASRDFQQGIGVAISQQIARGEDNQNANFNILSREAAANAREAAKCCCEAKLLAVQNQAKTDAALATVIANQDSASKVADAVANAMQTAKLDTLLSERGHHGRG